MSKDTGENKITPLAITNYRDLRKRFGIKRKDRKSHMYILGKTGTGKSTLLKNMIVSDIRDKNGLAVIDPHGDLIEDIKGFLHEYAESSNDSLNDRVVLIDPTDPDYTVVFNPLEEMKNISIPEQAKELVSSFKRIWSEA